MKSVLQAINLLTVAFGNLIVIIVAEAKAFDQVYHIFYNLLSIKNYVISHAVREKFFTQTPKPTCQ